jgi:hypothetical protein
MRFQACDLAERRHVNRFQQTIDWQQTQPTASRQTLVGSGCVNFGKGEAAISESRFARFAAHRLDTESLGPAIALRPILLPRSPHLMQGRRWPIRPFAAQLLHYSPE